MTWPWARRILVLLGVLWLVTAIPPSVRPTFVSAPFRRPEQTITIPALDSGGQMPPNLNSRIGTACRPPWVLRSLLGGAKRVRIVTTWQGRATGVRELNCGPYL